MKSILFVCLGNICRSPTAQAVFADRLERAGLVIELDSAGTIPHHQGRPPDSRAIHHGRLRGLELEHLRAREVVETDFHRFDRIFAMDRANLAELQRRQPTRAAASIELLMSLAPDYGLEEVPDPYYGGDQGFERVLDMLDAAAQRLVEQIIAAC
ncbi:MAG: low molecular weight protein-tyrosine-phosphatase [Pseudomonadota bacterium]